MEALFLLLIAEATTQPETQPVIQVLEWLPEAFRSHWTWLAVGLAMIFGLALGFLINRRWIRYQLIGTVVVLYFGVPALYAVVEEWGVKLDMPGNGIPELLFGVVVVACLAFLEWHQVSQDSAAKRSLDNLLEQLSDRLAGKPVDAQFRIVRSLIALSSKDDVTLLSLLDEATPDDF